MATTKKTAAEVQMDNLHNLTKDYFNKVSESVLHHPAVEHIATDADENTLQLARQIGVSIIAGLGVFALQRYIESPKGEEQSDGETK